ncbi:hypothetical protein P609_07875 [Comamonas thiooxydans]|nr:hypothetical protein P609_07875 [Comamonas thiooxydans]
MSMAVCPKQLQRGRAEVQSHFLQSTRCKVFLAGIGRHNREADALPCTCHGQLSAVDAVAAADRHLDDFPRGVLKLPGLALQRAEGGDAGQGFQLTHMAWHTGPGQQGGGGNHDAGQCGEFAGDESTVLLMAPVKNDGKVHVFSKYFQSGHPGIAFELDPRMEATEFGEDGGQQFWCFARHADLQRSTQFALHRAKLFLRREQGVEQGLGTFVEQSTGFRHAQVAGASLQQPCTESALQ